MKRTTLRRLFSLLLMILLVGVLACGCADGSGEPQELFFMQDKVNNFSGVGDK